MGRVLWQISMYQHATCHELHVSCFVIAVLQLFKSHWPKKILPKSPKYSPPVNCTTFLANCTTTLGASARFLLVNRIQKVSIKAPPFAILAEEFGTYDPADFGCISEYFGLDLGAGWIICF